MNIDKIKFLINKFLDFFFPEFCFKCGHYLSYPDIFICKKCLKILTPNDITKIHNDNENIKIIYSIYDYHKISEILIEAKLHYRKKVLIALLNFIKNRFNFDFFINKIDIILPVPLEKNKIYDRGFNQSNIIAKMLFSNEKIKNNVLYKTKHTEDQKILNYEKRKENLKNAFTIKNSELLYNKNILIVDDVITTSATVKEIADSLIKYGCNNIYVFALSNVKSEEK